MTPKLFLACLQRQAFLSKESLTFHTMDPHSPEAIERATERLRRTKLALGDPNPEVTAADLESMLAAASKLPWSRLDSMAEGMHRRLLASASPPRSGFVSRCVR
jgi:hypothetical protein